jgi:hypothetical protein
MDWSCLDPKPYNSDVIMPCVSTHGILQPDRVVRVYESVFHVSRTMHRTTTADTGTFTHLKNSAASDCQNYESIFDLRSVRVNKDVKELPLILVAFYSPGPTDPTWNHVVSRVSGPVCHVELAFPKSYQDGVDTKETMTAVCVYFNEKVEVKDKRYNKPGYTFMCFHSTDKIIAKIKVEANKMIAGEVAFSQYSMIATFLVGLPLWYPARVPDATCCSILTTQLLQVAGILESSINARRVTPMGLKKLCHQDHACKFAYFGVAPSRLRDIKACAASGSSRKT